MRITVLKIISYLALTGTIIPALLVFFGQMDIQTNKNIMAVSMVVWFVSAPFWINKKTDEEVLD
jgi:hypothetical protein